MLSNCLFIDDPDSECEVDGVNIDGSFLIVPWASKCQKHGCAEQVLPSNVKVSRKGNIIVKLFIFIYLLSITILKHRGQWIIVLDHVGL
jgi:hypothetical protein